MDETKQINFCFLLVYKVSLEICKLEAGSNNQKIIYSEMNLANANKYWIYMLAFISLLLMQHL